MFEEGLVVPLSYWAGCPNIIALYGNAGRACATGTNFSNVASEITGPPTRIVENVGAKRYASRNALLAPISSLTFLAK